jgi:hypothetical protein
MAKLRIKLNQYSAIMAGIFHSAPSYTPKAIYSPAVSAMHELFEGKKLSNNFAAIKNKTMMKDNSINSFFVNIVKALVGTLKDVLAEQITYNKKKKSVYSIYIPKSFQKQWKIPIIRSIYDFDKLLVAIGSNLIFSDAQKRSITLILMQIQRNILSGNKNPEKIRECTTQLFLAGPPGTAKTQLAYLISEVTGLPIIVLSVSSLILLKGMAIRVLTELFLEAKMEKCFVFTDETEVILMKRSEIIAQNNVARARFNKKDSDFSSIIYDLFTVYLALTGNKSINIIAATNKPDILDPAIRRRFEHVMEMDLPERHIRKKIFLKYFLRYGIRFSDASLTQAAEIGALHTGEFSKDIKLNNFSGSEIQGICIRLVEMNKPIKQKNNKMISITNTTDLVNTIQNRISIHRIFGADVRMSSAGGVGKDGLIDDQSVLKNEEDRMARGKRKAVAHDVISRIELMHKIMKPTGLSEVENYNLSFRRKMLNRQHKTFLLEENIVKELTNEDNNYIQAMTQRKTRGKNIVFGFSQVNYFIPNDKGKKFTSDNDNCIIQIGKNQDNTNKIITSIVDGIVSQQRLSQRTNDTVMEQGNKKRQGKNAPLERSLLKILKKDNLLLN